MLSPEFATIVKVTTVELQEQMMLQLVVTGSCSKINYGTWVPVTFLFLFFFAPRLRRWPPCGGLDISRHDVPHPEDVQCSLELSCVVQEESYYCHL